MMIWIYHILAGVAFTLALPVLPLVFLASKKRRANLVQRLGFWTRIPEKQPHARRIWIHALSVGEVRSALPLVRAFEDRFRGGEGPPLEIFLTASTRTGFRTAQDLFDRERFPLVAGISYSPFDLWFSVDRITQKIQPDLVCLVETDFWPGFLHAMDRQGVPVALVNARMSASSLKGYMKLGPLKSLFFPLFSHVLVQTRQDRDRFARVGVPLDRISIVGNMKFDMPVPVMDTQEQNELRFKLGISPEDRVWIAGSTHEEEEAMILEAFGRLKIPDLKLILAPRNPDRCPGLVPLIREKGFEPGLYSKAQTHPISPNQRVILVDVMGVLAGSYAVCDAAFVGGSLVPEGGHNPLEPAMLGKPVVFGPHMADFIQVAQMLTRDGGGQAVENVQGLVSAMTDILTDSDLARTMGRAGRKVFRDHAGAVDRTMAILEQFHGH